MLEVTRTEFEAAHLVVIVDEFGAYRWSATEDRSPSAVAKMLRGIADQIDPPEPRTIPARSTDPHTSHAATTAIRVKAGTQRHRLLAAFAQDAAEAGLTDEEAADLADGVPYRSEFAKRCSELRMAGFIELCLYAGTSSPVTRKGVAGQERIVCQITDAGRAAVRRAEAGS